MAKFISLKVQDNASQYLNVEHLINVDGIIAVEQTADQTVRLILDNSTSAHKIVTFTAQVDPSGTPANPVYGTGAPLASAINYALTANPGGVKAKVFAPVDDNGAKVYFTDIAYS
tara:strand:+ start:6277 stop:6621 length:345 start_codon:yes stop_codon:yes gene_type:complete